MLLHFPQENLNQCCFVQPGAVWGGGCVRWGPCPAQGSQTPKPRAPPGAGTLPGAGGRWSLPLCGGEAALTPPVSPPRAAVKFGRMSKKQRDSLYAEVQKHQQSQEQSGGTKEEPEPLSRVYTTSVSSGLSDLDDISTLSDGLLFDFPLTPDGSSTYYNLDLLASAQPSPDQSSLDVADATLIKQESVYELMLEPALFAHGALEGGQLSAEISVLELGERGRGPGATPGTRGARSPGNGARCSTGRFAGRIQPWVLVWRRAHSRRGTDPASALGAAPSPSPPPG